MTTSAAISVVPKKVSAEPIQRNKPLKSQERKKKIRTFSEFIGVNNGF